MLKDGLTNWQFVDNDIIPNKQVLSCEIFYMNCFVYAFAH